MLDTERKQNAKKQKKVRAVTPLSCIVLTLIVPN